VLGLPYAGKYKRLGKSNTLAVINAFLLAYDGGEWVIKQKSIRRFNLNCENL